MLNENKAEKDLQNRKDTMIIATQIDPAEQESDLYRDDFYDDNFYSDILINGNSDMETLGQLLDSVAEYDRDVDELEEIYNDKTISDSVKVKKFLHYFPGASENYKDWETAIESGKVEDILTAITGEKYDCTEIHGCVQSEWNNLYYPVNSYDDSAVEDIAVRYFNTGREWVVKVHPNPHDVTDESVNYIYTTSDDDETTRIEIANELASLQYDDSNIILRKFDDYDSFKSANYVDDPATYTYGERKEQLCDELGHLLKKYDGFDVSSIRYFRDENSGTEIAQITHENDVYNVDITGDSNIAVIYDIVNRVFHR